jgi:leader peptidase (prepilin peptidase)/N-methyltransferase
MGFSRSERVAPTLKGPVRPNPSIHPLAYVVGDIPVVVGLPVEASIAPALRAPLRPESAWAAAPIAVAVSFVVLALGEASAWRVAAAATAGVLVWLAAIDLETRLIPNRIVVPTAAALLGVAFAVDVLQGVEHALAAAVVGGCLLLAALLRPGALGMGDVKLGLLLGALLGGEVLTGLTIGFVLVAAAGVVVVAREGRAALQRQLPLAPFLAAGAIAALLVG